MGDAIVKSGVVVYQVVDHPRSGTAANHEHYLWLFLRPRVPKMSQRPYETRFRSVETREFVDEYDTTSVGFEGWLQYLTQRKECIHPRLGCTSVVADAAQPLHKGRHLFGAFTVDDTADAEGIFVTEKLVN